MIVPVYTPSLLFAVGIGAIRPVLLLAAIDVGFDHAGASAVVGLFGVMGVVAAPFLGKLLAATGDRPALAGAGVLAMISLAMCVGVMIDGGNHRDIDRYSFVIALMALAVAANIWNLGRQSYIAEHVRRDWRARGMSTLGGLQRLGDLLGPLFSSGLLAVWFLGSVFLFAAVTSALALAMILVFLVPDERAKVRLTPTPQGGHTGVSEARSLGEPGAGDGNAAGTKVCGGVSEKTSGSSKARAGNAGRGFNSQDQTASAPEGGSDEPSPGNESAQPSDKFTSKLVPSTFATFVMGVGLNTLTILRANRDVIVPLWGTYLGLDARLITLTFAISALLDSGMFLAVGSVTDKFGRLAAIIPSLTVMSAGIIVMAVWQTTLGFITGAIILGIGNGFGAGILMTTGADLSPSGRRRAEFLGIWLAICNTGTAAGPFIASGMTHFLSVSASLWATVAIGLAGTAWSLLLVKPAYITLGMDTRGRLRE